MPGIYSTDEVLKNFVASATSAGGGHLTRSVIWMVIAILFLFSGLAAMFYSNPILAALLLLSAVLCNQKSNAHHVMAEMSNQHCAMAHLIASVAPKIEADKLQF